MTAFNCKDRERALREQEPALLEALEQHAAHCAECAAELSLWNEMSAAARAMHRSWESPRLWPAIQRRIEDEASAAPAPRAWTWGTWMLWPGKWQVAGALALFLALSIAGAWLALRRPPAPPTASHHDQRRLLTEQAMREVEKSEAAYLAAIEKLSALAQPSLERPRTPLLASYREKLLLLDAAIAECRAQIETNPGQPQLRQELLAMYRDKQQTLQLALDDVRED